MRDGGRGPSSDLAAWKATPQVGSDGAELARRGRLYGLPLLLESGDGRRVVTAEVNPTRTSCSGASGRPRAAFKSLERRKPRRQGGWVPTTLTRGDGSAARTGTPEPEPLLVRFPPRSLGSGRRHGPPGWGMGSCATSGPGREPGSGPEPRRPRRARAQAALRPFPHGLGRDFCARPAQCSAHACFFPLSSLPMATPPRVLVSEPCLTLALGEASSFLALAFGARRR